MRIAILSLVIFLLSTPVRAGKERPIHETKSGLRYEILDPGEGVRPKPGDEVSVRYVGRLKDGRVFDTNYGGKPLTFKLGTGYVIPGWDEGVALMRLGAKYRFRIPYKLAYGERGSPPEIPPRADLVFDVELLAIKEGIPLPEFPVGHPERQITTKSGLKYEVLVEGKGEPPRDDQGVKIAFGLWNKEGLYVQSTAGTKRYIAGPVGTLRIGPYPMKFLPEAVRHMKEGTVLRLEVPAKLCWGDRRMHPRVGPGETTIWQLLLVKINDIPAYRKPDPAKARTTKEGLVYEILREGEGRRPGAKSSVEVRYTSWVIGGRRFDSSHARGDTAKFPLSRAQPPGMVKALRLMREGAVFLVRIPKSLGYGKTPPRGSGVPPDAELVFLVELVRVL